MKGLPNLDFIRAVAVVSVVVEHALLALGVQWLGSWQVAWIGVVGVFIFFVHTTLVLMWSLERKPHTLDFYIRRIFRIYPLAIAAFAAVLIFHAPVNGTPRQFFYFIPPPHALDYVEAITLSGNLFRGYLPMSVMWSLPYEVQMYVVLPVIFFFTRRNFQQWPLLLFWTFTVMLCRTIFRGVDGHNFFLCIPYFLPGVMAYVGFGRRRATLPAWTLPIALGLAWALFMMRPGWRVADVLCLAVGLGLPSFHQIKAKWLIRASHTVAKYSYGIYLAHPFGLVLGIYLMPHAPVALQMTVLTVSTVVLAVGGYHLLEHPMMRLGSRIANKAERRFEQFEADKLRIPVGEVR